MLTSGQAAKAAGVGVETLRFYERKGLLPKPTRRTSGYRVYTPESVDRLRAEDLSRLPYLADALTRLLQELPWSTDGLSRTERALLMPLYDGPRRFDETFLAQMRAEERPFLGDTTALWRLSLLAQGDHPLLTIRDELALTESGRRVLEAKLDAVELRGIDRSS